MKAHIARYMYDRGMYDRGGSVSGMLALDSYIYVCAGVLVHCYVVVTGSLYVFMCLRYWY